MAYQSARLLTIASFGVFAPTSIAQWSVTSLHPPGATSSSASGVDGTQQVGSVVIDGVRRAARWEGMADSWVDLSPSAAASTASGVSNGWQVGSDYSNFWSHAALWNGDASTWVDLHPDDQLLSYATDTDGEQQVGYTAIPGVLNYLNFAAALWSGTAQSWVRLAEYGSMAYAVHDGVQVGDSGGSPFSSAYATLWRGTPESIIILHQFDDSPNPVIDYSAAYGVHRDQQVGVSGSANHGFEHAVLWTGTADSQVNLHPGSGWHSSAAYGVHEGWQVGSATSNQSRACVWRGSASSFEPLPALSDDPTLQTVATAVWTDATTIYVVGREFNYSVAHSRALMWTRPIVDCPADFNTDGRTDFFDITAWLHAFNSQAASADFNGDGVINFADVQAFLTAFNAGCP